MTQIEASVDSVAPAEHNEGERKRWKNTEKGTG